MTDYFKALGYDGYVIYGGTGRWTPGRWRSVRGRLIPCRNGLHLCTLDQLPGWLGPTIWRAEVHPDSEIIEADDKVVVRKARIVEQLPWDGRTARLFAADCAERVLPIFEAAHPEDDRPRRAISAARAYADGEIREEELRAARDDAWYARDAAWDARDAAWDARDAAYAATYAAWAAAYAASTLYSTGSAGAAREAARYAARVDGWAVWWVEGDEAAAWYNERRWQAERLANYLGL